MTKETIKCPDCGAVIELSEAISHDIEIRLKQLFDNEIGKAKKSIEEKAKNEAQELADLARHYEMDRINGDTLFMTMASVNALETQWWE